MEGMYEVTITKIENGDRKNAKIIDTLTFIYIGVFDGFHTYEAHMNGEIFNVVRYIGDMWEMVAEATMIRSSGGYDYEDREEGILIPFDDNPDYDNPDNKIEDECWFE